MWLSSDTSIEKQTKPTLETGVASAGIGVIPYFKFEYYLRRIKLNTTTQFQQI